jgi:hypothetical protein
VKLAATDGSSLSLLFCDLSDTRDSAIVFASSLIFFGKEMNQTRRRSERMRAYQFTTRSRRSRESWLKLDAVGGGAVPVIWSIK